MSRKSDSQSINPCTQSGKKCGEEQKKSFNKLGGSKRDGSTGGAGNTNSGPVGT